RNRRTGQATDLCHLRETRHRGRHSDHPRRSRNLDDLKASAWRRTQPREGADFTTAPEFQKSVQFVTLAVAQITCESLKQLAFGAHDDLGTQALQHRQSRDNDGSPPQFIDTSPDQDDTAVGLQGRWHQPGRKRAILRDAEGAQPIMKLQLGQVLPAGFVTLCIACPRTCRKPELSCQEGKKFGRRGLIWQQRASWIS
ncbi:MAG: hypothetical protein JWQ49_3465, partial [Edaphobacter sp.]|nr:hypothetical protein [Edaphobacter sp.]